VYIEAVYRKKVERFSDGRVEAISFSCALLN
jgi:hypothetical protein